MGASSGSLNTRGFGSSLSAGSLPSKEHITHTGLINQNYFRIKAPAKNLLELEVGSAMSNIDLFGVDPRNYFLTLTVKSSMDGKKRNKPLNVVICLDISGSMSCRMGDNQQNTRLSLAREAIWKLFQKLEPQDSFGMVIFNDVGTILYPCTKVSQLDAEQCQYLIKDRTFNGGGTTLRSGFMTSLEAIRPILEATKGKDVLYENRIVMLTDVQDNSLINEKALIEDMHQKENIAVTIVGISSSFKSSVCEQLITCKQFNYFCAIDDKDLQEIIVDQFDYTFFSCASQMRIELECDDMLGIQAYGTTDWQTIRPPLAKGHFLVTESETVFPMPLLTNEKGQISGKGGIILVKFSPKDKTKLPKLSCRIKLTYKDCRGIESQEVYAYEQEFTAEQFYSSEDVNKAINLFYYAEGMRNMLTPSSDMDKEDPKVLERLTATCKELLKLAPNEDKTKEIRDLAKILKINLE